MLGDKGFAMNIVVRDLETRLKQPFCQIARVTVTLLAILVSPDCRSDSVPLVSKYY
jgi:hypothetical protein